jgi:outer membrane protein assembly factor BamB
VKGVLYFGNDAGTLSAVHVATGSPAWSYTIPSNAPIHSSPAVDQSGQILFGANDGNFYALNANGSLAGSVSLGGNLGAPAYANGKIVVASTSGNVYSLNDPNLTTNWSVNAGSPIAAAPAFDGNAGLVIVGTTGGTTIAYNSSTGNVAWTGSTGGSISSVAIANHTVFAASADGNVYAFAEGTGAFKFKVPGDGTAVTALAVNGNGPTFGTSGGTMLDSNANGHVYYERSYGNIPIAGLAVAGTDAFGSTTKGNLELLRSSDGGWHFSTNSTFGASPVILDGMLFAGADDGNLYAFVPEGYTPAPQASVRLGSAIVTINGNCVTP